MIFWFEQTLFALEAINQGFLGSLYIIWVQKYNFIKIICPWIYCKYNNNNNNLIWYAIFKVIPILVLDFLNSYSTFFFSYREFQNLRYHLLMVGSCLLFYWILSVNIIRWICRPDFCQPNRALWLLKFNNIHFHMNQFTETNVKVLTTCDHTTCLWPLKF